MAPLDTTFAFVGDFRGHTKNVNTNHAGQKNGTRGGAGSALRNIQESRDPALALQPWTPGPLDPRTRPDPGPRIGHVVQG